MSGPGVDSRQISDQGGERDDRRERNACHDQAERQDRHEERSRRVDDATAHPEHSRGDERDHGGPEPAHDTGDGCDLTELDVDRAHGAEQDEGRQDEQAARGDRTSDAMHRVADVGRELLRLGPGERHAEVERVQEAPLRDPAPTLDELVVHDRDLPRRPAEADHPELQPEPERLPFARSRPRLSRCRHGRSLMGRRLRRELRSRVVSDAELLAD